MSVELKIKPPPCFEENTNGEDICSGLPVDCIVRRTGGECMWANAVGEVSNRKGKDDRNWNKINQQ